jgi:predicted glycoside hydrolase/deacetylase ChbG (UPF0249 family)
MAPALPRQLLIIADDFGMGPATSRGILRVAELGLLSATVLLVNSPHTADAVQAWHGAGQPVEIGWHPNLTLDAPLSPAEEVPSLVDAQGRFHVLSNFLARWAWGQLRYEDVTRELSAQYDRFVELMGHPPRVVNTHQHVAVCQPVGHALLNVLREKKCVPYVRRIREKWRTYQHVPGARVKRVFLHVLGRRFARACDAANLPGNQQLLGISDPRWVGSDTYFPRWLRAATGQCVELMCHPGEFDATLFGRDCAVGEGLAERRVAELAWMRAPGFRAALADAGFHVASINEFMTPEARRVAA